MDARVQVARARAPRGGPPALAPPPRWSSSVGTTTMVRASSGTPPGNSRRGSRRGGARRTASRCTSAMASSLAGSSRSTATIACMSGEASWPRAYGDAGGHERRGQQGDRAEVGHAGVAEREPPDAPRQARAVGDVGLEVAAALADQVVADVGGAVGGGAGLGRLPRALHRAQRHAHLGLAGGLGQLLHRVPVAVAAEEVHARVDPGGVALQHALDQAHRLDVLAPVERRAQPQAGDHVGHRHLGGGLALVLARGSPPPRSCAGRAGARPPPARTAESRVPYSRRPCSSCTTKAMGSDRRQRRQRARALRRRCGPGRPRRPAARRARPASPRPGGAGSRSARASACSARPTARRW